MGKKRMCHFDAPSCYKV